MSRRHAKPKGFGYYFSRVVLLGLFLFGGKMYGSQLWEYYNKPPKLPIDEILAQSPLKDKKFASTVQIIATDKLKAYFMEEHSNPIVSVDFRFEHAGEANEPEDKGGITTILAEMLTAGAGKWNERQFKDLCAEHGIKIGFAASLDDFTGHLQFPRQYQQTAVALFQAVIKQPHFNDDYLQTVQQQMLMMQKLQQERPEKVLMNKYKEFIFAGHPYERNPLGTAESVSSITRNDLEDFRQQYLAQDNLIISIAGDLTTKEAATLLQNLFQNLPEKSMGEKLQPLDLTSDGTEYPIERKNAQAIAQFSAAGTFRNNVDFYPLYMANYIFGESGLNARLNKVIREDNGLTYGIYTYLSITDAVAQIRGGFSATPENFTAAKDLLYAEWRRLAQEGISQQELDAAKKSLLASYNLRFAAIDDIAAMLTMMQKFKLGADFLDKRNDYITEVSLLEVNAAAKKYFNNLPDIVYIGAITSEDKK